MARPTPGKLVLDCIHELGVTQNDFAIKAGMSHKHLWNVIHSKAPISIRTAFQLERATGQPAEYWAKLWIDYHISQVRKENGLPAPTMNTNTTNG